jgi:hypothetical protein
MENLKGLKLQTASKAQVRWAGFPPAPSIEEDEDSLEYPQIRTTKEAAEFNQKETESRKGLCVCCWFFN